MSETTTAAEVAAPHRYTAALAADIEARWQDFWDADGTYAAPNPSGELAGDPAVVARPKKFIMDMFPYPSGAGLHVGHPLGYIATDVYARYHRMTGHNVLHTLGFDAFGLPAEQYAVQTGTHPRVSTEANMENMKAQLRRLGLGHDKRRSFATIDPEYYKWTQWIFLQIFNSWYDDSARSARPIADLIAQFENGEREVPGGRVWSELSAAERDEVLGGYRLAYASDAPVNWCPGLGTVLANEEVTADGRSERGNYPVFKAKLRQWNMRITAYADRLLEDLEPLDWPEAIKLQQRNWIGRSEGARVDFRVSDGSDAKITVFTTRPDTLFGATYMVLAPEHDLIDSIVPAAWPEGTKEKWTGGAATPAEAVAAYRKQAQSKTDVERQTEGKDKTGVFTGAYALNPLTGERVPVFVGDYVLMGYGTGAIMAVPGQDERDWEFATAFELPVVRTVQPPEGWEGEAYTGQGPAINSANDEIDLNGMQVDEAKRTVIAYLTERGIGEGTVNFRLRDWLFSRQRYWGEPFPIVYDEDGVAHALPESMLPLELPEVEDYSPRTFDPDDADTSPETPLSRNEEWVDVTLDLGDGPKRYRRETNTMPNWAGSCWYELRYLDPHNSERLVSDDAERYWMGPREGQPLGGVDLYVGGAEHAVLHLLYARFWSKILFDLGHISSSEPFHKLFNQGMIQAYVYRDARGIAVPAAEVEERDGGAFYYEGGKVSRLLGKMGKSLKNAVTPDEICAEYGADTLRLYEMAMGPLDVSRPWDTRAVVGQYRLLQRLWRNVVDEATGEVTVVDAEPDEATLRALHKAVDGIGQDMANLRFNTAIAKFTELNNFVTKLDEVPRSVAEQLVLLIAPLAPHIAEELWRRLGHQDSVVHRDFPVADPAYVVDETVTCVVQLKGKVKARLEVSPAISDEELEKVALGDPAVVAALGGAGIRKVIVRAPKLVNIVPA
ncbi:MULTISPECIES: leucine--tRNA ligase [Streptomyces]|uniref:Leucine--tRNA ligase n=1 Tax=Streptomyces morookaense TaxID=1970 RepID=A0A7Y7B5K2_STRMO|nr:MULTISPECIES: leucine--tRNA ligase [Streptomyces]MCC2275326.1 leucine--tRNA ligase [Streptomyces sp. ET3-23]NVK79387.1 leucine--tRNA ligase [Streptomyces morookaense]GHF42564.1 leucine--tRNA ligase [Streptomyces morookaense]